jgi:hypothetical protein
MVFRRSTTLWTWLRAFKKAPRSTVIFIGFALASGRSFQPSGGAGTAPRRGAITP